MAPPQPGPRPAPGARPRLNRRAQPQPSPKRRARRQPSPTSRLRRKPGRPYRRRGSPSPRRPRRPDEVVRPFLRPASPSRPRPVSAGATQPRVPPARAQAPAARRAVGRDRAVGEDPRVASAALAAEPGPRPAPDSAVRVVVQVPAGSVVRQVAVDLAAPQVVGEDRPLVAAAVRTSAGRPVGVAVTSRSSKPRSSPGTRRRTLRSPRAR